MCSVYSSLTFCLFLFGSTLPLFLCISFRGHFGASILLHIKLYHSSASTESLFFFFENRHASLQSHEFVFCCLYHQEKQSNPKLGYMPVCAAWTQTELSPETSGTEARRFSLRAALSAAHDQLDCTSADCHFFFSGSDDLAQKLSFINQRLN